MKRKHKNHKSSGQALVEFALIAIVLLLLFFIIIEVGRVFWAWISVQNAARSGARYAVTGQFDPDCLSDPTPCADPRVVSIQETVLDGLINLNLNQDPGRTYEDDFAVFIEIYGIDSDGQLQADFAGVPGQPMAVRVIYNVPIITPILSGIVQNIPVMGQVVQNNELFGQTGAITTGQSIAPPLPAIPTAGPTPTPTHTPTPTSTATATPGPSPTATDTATPTSTATPLRCNVEMEGVLLDGQNQIPITGDLNTIVQIRVASEGNRLIGTVNITNAVTNHKCQGFVVATLTESLVSGQIIVAESSDASFDVKSVLEGTPTNTPVPTLTTIPTNTPTPTSTASSTPTPSVPTVFLDQECAFGPNIQITVRGFNWNNSDPIYLYWDGNLQTIIAAGHGGIFQQLLRINNVPDKDYEVRVVNGSLTDTTTLEVPCSNVTPTPVTAVPTNTPSPADLIIVGPPVLNTNPPIIGYRPVSFTVQITNSGDIDVNDQFFVDLYLDPPADEILPEGIDVDFSSGYVALSGIGAKTSKAVTITSQLGFQGPEPVLRDAYGMVDSIYQVVEDIETNNVSELLEVAVTPGATPTPSPTPPSAGAAIAGEVRTLISSKWKYQGRAIIYLVLVEPNLSQETIVGQTTSGILDGYYAFPVVAAPPSSSDYYKLVACFRIDGEDRVHEYFPVVPPDPFANLYLLTDPSGCPYQQ
ncbi:MAG: TadE/TadG family type IV pilus assembly protein [Ardenticatenaceae bacterium]|nr:TadE/TadG family type IV pilus assembly protein [Ardenticatenaceae bacterium]